MYGQCILRMEIKKFIYRTSLVICNFFLRYPKNVHVKLVLETILMQDENVLCVLNVPHRRVYSLINSFVYERNYRALVQSKCYV